MKEQTTDRKNLLTVDPYPRFDLSPNLYMQFMEPLGATDGSVEAAWDHLCAEWRDDVIQVTKELAPPLMRWGGCLSSYYRWREGVGPRARRKPMHNLCWGGIESNQVGTYEFVDFCRRVGAQAFFCVNFESDGRKHWARPGNSGIRSAGPKEAAAWVDYCNNPENKKRWKDGAKEPFALKLWQIGNETSYDSRGYNCETAAKRTIAFARAMRKVDPDIKLIGWGDSGWAKQMLEIAGEHIDMLAFHNAFDANSRNPDSPLRSNAFRRDPAAAWEHLMQAYRQPEAKIREIREQLGGVQFPLAITESHFSLPGRNRCEVLSTWAAGVANARILNVHEKNGDVLKIATLADFCGTRWQVNAIMIPTPRDRGKSFMMPVARVMSLYRKHSGSKAISIKGAPVDLDVTASRTDKNIFLHIVNTNRVRSTNATIQVIGMSILGGSVFEIADDPMREIDETTPELFSPIRHRLPSDAAWCFPPASVTAVEMEVRGGSHVPPAEPEA